MEVIQLQQRPPHWMKFRHLVVHYRLFHMSLLQRFNSKTIHNNHALPGFTAFYHLVNHHVFNWLLSEWHHKLIFLIINIFLANRGVHRTVVGQKSAHTIIGQHHGSVGWLGTARWRPGPRIPAHSVRGRTCLISIVIVHITILCHKGTITWYDSSKYIWSRDGPWTSF